jgi:methyl-accepting chemotaxis protein
MLTRLRERLWPPDRERGTGRVVPLHLVLVLAFVLLAVIELTRTWFGAMHIAENLAVLDTRLKPVILETDEAERLFTTSQLTGEILEQTEPLPGQLVEVNRTVNDIQANAQDIQRNAVAINADARNILATVAGINTTAEQLLGTVRSIEATAGAIEGNARSINETFAALLPVVELIDDGPEPFGVRNINQNVNQVIALSQDIEADLSNVLDSVREVDEHAESICGAPILFADCRLDE